MQRCQTLLALFILVLMLPISNVHARSTRHSPHPPDWCQSPGFYCERVKGGQSCESLFPEARERGIVMRINRTNRPIYGGIWIKVPDNLANSNLLDYAPFTRTIEAPGEKLIVVDLTENAWGAYDAEGFLVRWGPATGGNDWCKDISKSCRTKAGHFRIYSLGSSNCVSRKFPRPRGGAPMPYCMFFNGGQALHGSPGEVMRDNVSHGCVRLFVSDAEWLRYDFVEGPNEDNNYRGTQVIVRPY
jgi:hypothetical protein